jgi:hypothetical protein
MEAFNSEQTILPQINFIKEGVKMGFINGVIALVLMYVSYYAGMDVFVDTQFISGFVPYMIVILIVYGFQLRKKNGGYLSFKDGIQYAFMSYVIVTIVIALGTFVLFNVIDKNLTQKTFDLSLEKTRKLMQGMGAKQEDIDKQLESIGAKGTGAKNFILGIGLDLIWSFVKSLLITLIIRREKPAF